MFREAIHQPRLQAEAALHTQFPQDQALVHHTATPAHTRFRQGEAQEPATHQDHPTAVAVRPTAEAARYREAADHTPEVLLPRVPHPREVHHHRPVTLLPEGEGNKFN